MVSLLSVDSQCNNTDINNTDYSDTDPFLSEFMKMERMIIWENKKFYPRIMILFC